MDEIDPPFISTEDQQSESESDSFESDPYDFNRFESLESESIESEEIRTPAKPLFKPTYDRTRSSNLKVKCLKKSGKKYEHK